MTTNIDLIEETVCWIEQQISNGLTKAKITSLLNKLQFEKRQLEKLTEYDNEPNT